MNAKLSGVQTHQTFTISYQSSMPKVAFHLKITQEKSKFIKDQSINHLIDRGANGGLAGADMRVL